MHLLSKLQFPWYLSHQGNSLETKLIACSAGELGSVLVSGSPEGKGNLTQDPLEKGKATHSSILGLPWWFRW